MHFDGGSVKKVLFFFKKICTDLVMDVLVGGEGGSGSGAVGLIYSLFWISHRSGVFGLDFNFFVLGIFIYLFF